MGSRGKGALLGILRFGEVRIEVTGCIVSSVWMGVNSRSARGT